MCLRLCKYNDDDDDREAELSNVIESLRSELSAKERDISALQVLGSSSTGTTVDRPRTPVFTAAGPGSDQAQDCVTNTLHLIASQLITDDEELDALTEIVDQVDISKTLSYQLSLYLFI